MNDRSPAFATPPAPNEMISECTVPTVCPSLYIPLDLSTASL